MRASWKLAQQYNCRFALWHLCGLACSEADTVQGGLSTADRIVAVSPGYAHEIQTPEGGWGLEGMISSRGYVLSGVLNGKAFYTDPAFDIILAQVLE